MDIRKYSNFLFRIRKKLEIFSIPSNCGAISGDLKKIVFFVGKLFTFYFPNISNGIKIDIRGQHAMLNGKRYEV